MDDGYVDVLIDGQRIGEVPVSEHPDPDIRRSQNLALASIWVPRLLRDFKPSRPLTPEDRYQRVLTAVSKTLKQDKTFAADLDAQCVASYGPTFHLESIVYRASGEARCRVCGDAFRVHPVERILCETTHRLCTGDIVKL